ncbi:bacteriochlorophyll 4-vinyl reductase [Altererythrobacter sp. GH1-8]|uniref:bacteriochlorophyll 4-vinyl reductase n=1 Tax=Altererythrobacter sp. GH1-8 TaxID=3349333 RepID=UPI00374CDC8D
MLIESAAIFAPEAGQEGAPALIGPNAVLQIVSALELYLGKGEARLLCQQSGNTLLPSDHAMIPEEDALRLHRALAVLGPCKAEQIARAAGCGTADYIIANRIPGCAVSLLCWLPSSLSAPLLMAAIKRHAWTFIGAGRFEPAGPWSFRIERTEFASLGKELDTLAIWYSAVFERLYRRLVDRNSECRMNAPRASRPELREFSLTRS